MTLRLGKVTARTLHGKKEKYNNKVYEIQMHLHLKQEKKKLSCIKGKKKY